MHGVLPLLIDNRIVKELVGPGSPSKISNAEGQPSINMKYEIGNSVNSSDCSLDLLTQSGRNFTAPLEFDALLRLCLKQMHFTSTF